MAYCTTDQVISEFKGIKIEASGTAIITSELERFIAEADALIDSVLSQRYVTPITSSNALIVVRNISIMLVSHRVRDILRVKSGDNNAEQDGRGGFKTLRDIATKTLNDIVAKKMNLTDATVAETGEGVSSYVSSNDVPFIFERGTEQW